jgi:hypothetical protein
MPVGAYELKRTWFHRALLRAGIEHESWRPGRGVDENRRVVEAVYSYYGELFLTHPYLQWAGVASMIGPAFYAGFRDLGLVPDAVRAAVLSVLGRASRRLARRAAGDLGSTRQRSSSCRRRSSRTRPPCMRPTSPGACRGSKSSTARA